MPHDPMLIEETKGWLARAETDIRAAKHDLSASPPILTDVVFHCQQAVEKVFKCFLVWHNTPFRKTHSLEELGEQVLDKAPSLKEIVDRAVPLTEYAWKFRYPGQPDEPSIEESKEALEIAEQACAAVVARLPKDVVGQF